MKTLTIKLPDSVNENKVKMLFASQLFAKGILSSGQAAEMAGVTKREFIENNKILNTLKTDKYKY